ncbi:MAG: [protein-PII] uridylyltransferase [Jatrophihabitantaceae bacterium]
MTPTRSESLSAVRDGVLTRPGLRCSGLRRELTAAYDQWLQALLPSVDGLALVAVGSLGRGEPAPYSDLDLVLLHDGTIDGLAETADSLWYPIWDSGVALDHSVRTPEQVVAVAKDDLRAMLGMLDVRHIGGDLDLSTQVRERMRQLWRASATARSSQLRELSTERAALAGEAAFLLEPNLKDSRGGLRDAQALQALAIAQLLDVPATVRQAYEELLDVRGELHRRTGRAEDVLRLQEQDGVAQALELHDGTGQPDRDALLRKVNLASRTIAHCLDGAWRRADPPVKRRRFGRASVEPERVGLARDVVAHDREVVLARDADPPRDPGLVVRAARAAAENGLPLADFTLARLAAEAAPLPVPWPDAVREDFLGLLGSGVAAVPVFEALDLAGLLERLIPEWVAVRCRAQRNPVHRFTVDRHLLETAAEAARHTRELDRPDLLLVGALLHDIGKGTPGDHSVVGTSIAAVIAERMGFSAGDVAVIAALTRHHLLLPDTATRRDLDDPATIRIVTDAVGQDVDLLELLYLLTIADAAATGPGAWSDWKGSLIVELVRRVRSVLHGAAPPSVPPLDEQRRALAETGELAVVICEDKVTVAVPDRVGALYRTAGVLALNLLDIRSASIRTYAGVAVNLFTVEPRFGRMPDPVRLRADLVRVLDGDTGLAGQLREKERTYARAAVVELQPPTVHWFDDEATDATVLEYRAADAIGLLCRVTAALERCQLDVRSARVSSVAGSVVDAFYVTSRDGSLVPVDRRADIEAELLKA